MTRGPQEQPRPTLEAVAARAGVGRGTVSRVINGSPRVSDAARRAVEEAIAELGYVPNQAARTLVTRRTNAVALVVSESEERVFGEPFFGRIVRAISAGLAPSQMQLWLAMLRSRDDRGRLEGNLTSQHVDGVMLLSLHDTDPLPDLLHDRGLPVVLGGRPARMLSDEGPPGLAYVDVDNAGGARQAVRHLQDRGRRRIATIAGPQDMSAGLSRLAGYREAVTDAGGEVDDDLVAFGDFSEAGGAVAMREVLARVPDLDAVFVASDLMAVGALRVLRDAGRRVPADVAVVGFEDSPVAERTEPPLTTVHQPVERMGREMVRLLLARIGPDDQRTVDDAPSVVLDTHLVARETT